MISNLSSALSRLCIGGLGSTYPLHLSKMFASGRWWPQPQANTKTTGNRTAATSGSQKCSSDNEVQANLTSFSDNRLKAISDTVEVGSFTDPDPMDLELFRDKAAPIFATPRGSGKKVYKTVKGKNGERLADYVLFEDSMNKAKVTWNEYSMLTSEERDIYMAHLKALRERRLWYKDPKTGLHVMCSSQLLLTGKCCGNGCRHCPYEHENAAPEVRKRKKWNGAFYV